MAFLINDNKKRSIQCVCSLSCCRELKLFPHVSQLKDAFTSETDSSDFSPVSLLVLSVLIIMNYI